MKSISLHYSSEIELIDDYVLNGSEKAANEFVRSFQKFVYSTALRYLQNHDEAEDAAQEVFIKALNNLSRFRKQSSVSTWLYRITQNVCTNITRKKKLRSFVNYNNSSEEFFNIATKERNAQQDLESSEFEVFFHEVLNKLPEKQRETFVLRYYEELPYSEISEMLGTSEGGLKANYFQAIKKLGKYLNESGYGKIESE